MSDRFRAIEGLALVAALTSVFGEIHPFCDQVVQNSHDASTKGMHGSHLVYVNDGSPVEENPWRTGKEGRTCTASAYGRRSVTRHVASYTAVQLATTVAVTRTLGYRVPVSALLTGAAINAITHGVIDRRDPLLWLAEKAGKTGYIKHATVVRKAGGEGTEYPEPVQDVSGPGTALMEIDQAVHRAVGVAAALVTAWITLRKGGRR
ncbi:hypothetical protein SLUN_38810 (plasmid) [Streptomyces lunaelactis]|uniref:Uncharacterized protein n=1 Tax=Streptomyces lunaelactis TaxID=1535768 RepID=A0A2R4TFS5_9ACTN|nr:hypothetical protein [Streptomyces lunaelactis]AVZ77982.1 hypothetical protein SLUN_38810 [Streptomyces lunaelactis]NUK84943.1 hypothetical protein [Streptomyces lunaelactis]